MTTLEYFSFPAFQSLNDIFKRSEEKKSDAIKTICVRDI